MNDFMRVLGLLSRDMLVMRGYFLPVRNLDGGTQREARPPAVKPVSSKHAAPRTGGCLSDPACVR
jgi:hypothetical protein